MKPLSLALAAALLAATAGAASAAAPIPDALHAYGLNSDYHDELGGPSLQAQGGKLTGKRYRFAAGQGLSLQGGVPATHYSIELHVAPKDITGYRRLVRFRSESADGGLYLNNGALEFYPVTSGTSATVAAGQLASIVITRDPASRIVSLYAGGVLQTQFEDTDNAAVFDTDAEGASLATFFIDDNGEDSAGTLNHLRTWDHVLSADAVSKLAKGKRPKNVSSQ